jgi:hypothetical protein
MQKLDVHLRKRGKLPEDSQFHDKKFDHVMVASLMSDDEDQVDENNQKTGRYLSRAPTYRNEIVSAIQCGQDEDILLCLSDRSIRCLLLLMLFPIPMVFRTAI